MKITFRSTFVIVAGIAVFSPASVADSDAIVGELKGCARIVASDTRAACYEALGKRVVQGETTTQATPKPVAKASTASTETVGAGTATAAKGAATATVAPSEKPSMTDNMGGYKFEEKPSDHPDNDIHTRVIQCQQNIDKEWYFKFENGQIWKQVDTSRRHFKSCDFPVVVSEDGFGYKMKIEGKDWRIRISRRK